MYLEIRIIFMPKLTSKQNKAKVKKLAVKKVVVKVAKEKPVGHVTHYFGNIKVGIIKFKKAVKVGDEIHIQGATTDFRQKIESMQYDHKEISKAILNKEVGLKVKKRVREGDAVYGT